MNGKGLVTIWIRVTLVWWVATAIFWSASDNRIAQTWSSLAGKVVPVDASNAGHISIQVLKLYTLPHLLAAILAAALGFGLIIAWYKAGARKRVERIRPDAKWRSITTSMGDLEKPRWVVTSLPDAEMIVTGDLSARVANMSTPQRQVLTEVLSFLSTKPDAFVGDGHDGTLLEHTLNVLQRLPARCQDPLLPIVAAAHDAGKVLAWTRAEDGTWKRKGWHDDLGGLLLSGMPSAHLLPESELRIAIIAVRYAHKPEKAPILIDATERSRLATLQDAVTTADHQATAAEKKKVLEKIDRGALLEQAFLESLSQMRFQTPGIKKGQEAAAWRKANRVYISELRFREEINRIMQSINADAAAAWAGRRQPGEIAQQTWDTLAMLRKKSWLVESIEGIEAYPPLWTIRSGNLNLSGIIIVDLPDSLTSRLPQNAQYEITVMKTHFPPTAANLDFPLPKRSGRRKINEPLPIKVKDTPKADVPAAPPPESVAAPKEEAITEPITAPTAPTQSQFEAEEEPTAPSSTASSVQASAPNHLSDSPKAAAALAAMEAEASDDDDFEPIVITEQQQALPLPTPQATVTEEQVTPVDAPIEPAQPPRKKPMSIDRFGVAVSTSSSSQSHQKSKKH